MIGPATNGRQLVDRLLADPPAVHAMDLSASPVIGVWSTDRACYDYIVQECQPGWRTLETGSGISTLLLASLGAAHTCVTPSTDEVDRLLAHATSRHIAIETVRFEVGPSDVILPTLTGPLDLVLIDGCHGYPATVLDWYYAGGRLVPGGVLILDDLQLPAVDLVHVLLGHDPRWRPAAGTAKWAAWQKVDASPLRQDWFEQPWFRGLSRPGLPRRVLGRLRPARREKGG